MPQNNTTRPSRKMVGAWEFYIQNLLQPFYKEVYNASLLIDSGTLKKAKYLEFFPHQLFSTIDPKNNKQFISPAACLQIYPTIYKTEQKNYSIFTSGHCARFENDKPNPPYRLQDFHMAELVIIGNNELIEESIKKLRTLVEQSFQDLSFNGEFLPASDAFFLGEQEGAKKIQLLKGLKLEYCITVNSEFVSLASINNHEDFFGKRFAITTDGKTAFSLCLAFGLERLAAYSTELWGEDPKNWPKKFTKYAKIL